MELLNGIARNPIPGGGMGGMFDGYDGTPLRYCIWNETRGPKRGTVCIFTGRTEYIEKYFEVVTDLRRRGFTVAIMDWRGQGGSARALRDKRKGHVVSFSEYDRDLVRFMKDVVLPDCLPPFYALAHSMGGNVLLRNATRKGLWFDRIVLTAPMIQFAPEALPYSFGTAKLMAEAGCLFGMGRRYVPGGQSENWENGPFEGNELTTDEERYERNKAIILSAPELGLGGPTFSWFRAACRSINMVSAPDYPDKVGVPILLFGAANDTVVSTRAIEDFALKLKVGSHVVIPNARHEILQERDELRQLFWATFDAYIMGEDPAGV